MMATIITFANFDMNDQKISLNYVFNEAIVYLIYVDVFSCNAYDLEKGCYNSKSFLVHKFAIVHSQIFQLSEKMIEYEIVNLM